MDTLNQALPKITETDCNDNKKRIGKGEHCKIHGLDFKELSYDYFRCPGCELKSKRQAEDEKEHNKRIQKAREALVVPARFSGSTFETYLAKTDLQKQVKARCIEFTGSWKESGGITMLGGVGTGKTHLAFSICKYLCENAVVCHFTNVNRMVRRVRSSWGGKASSRFGDVLTEEQVIKEYVSYDVLVIDEIGSQYGSDSERIIINEIINDRNEEMLPTIIIGNISVKDLKGILGERVVDRVKNNGYALFFDWESNRKLKAGK